MTEELVVRELDRDADEAALGRLDTSFTSDHIYTVMAKAGSLHLVLVPNTTAQKKQFTIALHDQPWTRGFVAVRNGLLQGFIATSIEEWHRRMVIWHFYVDRFSRRQGIGRRLMEHALEDGRAHGALTAWIETSNLNDPGVEAYRRLGFSLCGFDTTYYTGTAASDEFALFLARSLA